MNSRTGVKDYVGLRKCLNGHSLGELEAQILDIVWDMEPPISAAQVFKIMYPRRELSYSTVMLTLSKLAKKGLLKQVRSGDRKTDAFVYTPLLSRREVGARLLEEISCQIFHKPLAQALLDLAG